MTEKQEPYDGAGDNLHERQQGIDPPVDQLDASVADTDGLEPAVTQQLSPGGNDRSMDETVDYSPTDTEPTVGGAKGALSSKNFGDYELISEIARGGMGVVYKARQIRLNRTVALKMILSGEFAGDHEVQRFQAEAEAAAKLEHSGIVPVYEVGEHAGRHFFSMGFVAGSTLSAAIVDGPLANQQAAKILAKVVDAIAYAHDNGVIHRDLKPGNILIDEQGEPRVTDFGLAKRTDVDSELTGTGQVLGTPSYMAPEQAAGKTSEVGPLADVYSLGAILYCLITGRPPFQAANVMDTLMQVIQREPVPPRQLNSVVDRDLETICLKCLQKEPTQRYDSARTLKDELNRFLLGEPIHARPISSTARTWRWCRRNPVLASLISLATASLLIGTGVSIHFAIQAGTQADAALANADYASLQQKLAQNNESLARASEASARQSLYFADVDLARQLLEAGDISRASSLLATHVPGPSEQDLRRFEWAHLWRLRHGESFTVTWPQPDDASGQRLIRAVVIADDGKQVVVGGGQFRRGQVKIYPANSDQERWTSTEKMPLVNALALSANGQRVAGACGELGAVGAVKIWDIDNAVEQLSIDAGDPVMSLAWSADEQYLVTGAATLIDGSGSPVDRYFNVSGELRSDAVKIWDARSGELVVTLPGETGEVFSVAISADGKTIVAGDANGVVHFWDASTREHLGSVSTNLRFIWSLDFAPDGKTLAVAAGYWDESAPVSLVDVPTRQIKSVLRGHRAGVTCVKFAADGKSLASGSWDRTIKLWDLQQQVATATCYGHETYVWSLDFTADGKTLVSAGWGTSAIRHGASEVKFWDVAQQRRFTVVKGPLAEQGAYQRTDWGGSTVARVHPNPNEVTIWDTDGSERCTIAPYEKRNVRSVSVSRDGKLVATAAFAPTVKIWNAYSGELLDEFETGTAPHLAFSPDGRLLAVACDSGRVKLWDTTTRAERPDLIGHTDVVWWTDISPDGQRLASGSWDHTIKIWDTQTGRLLTTLAGHSKVVWKVALLHGERALLSADDQAIGLWDTELTTATHQPTSSDPPAHEIERAERSRWYALLAMMLEMRGETEAAEESYQQANRIIKHRAQQCPNIPIYQKYVLWELESLRSFYNQRGRLADAEKLSGLIEDLQKTVKQTGTAEKLTN